MGEEQPQGATGKLEQLARARFGETLTPSELKLIRAAPNAPPKSYWAQCGPNLNDEDPNNDPSKADKEWGTEREIRAEVIRWLCVDEKAKHEVDPKGIWVYGAKVTGKLDLSSVIVPFPIVLRHCRLLQDARLFNSQLPLLSLEGSWVRVISADRLDVEGDVFLRNGFRAEGELRLLGAQIGGNLDCSSGKFINFPGDALSADGMNVDGNVLLRDGFHAEGAVRLPGAQIGGNLECDGGTFVNPPGRALFADRIHVHGDVSLSDGFRAEGEVRLPEAQIGGNLGCDRGRFIKPSGKALNADGIDVRGYVFLRNDFRAEGEVSLPGAQIGGDLDCIDSTFTKLTAYSATVRGNFWWRGLKDAAGATLNLGNTSVGSIIDDEKSWPTKGNLLLDGFVYGRISEGPTKAKTRLEWLARQDPFKPQPYRQLAKVLRERGDEDGAVTVLEEMESLRRKEEDRTAVARLESWAFKESIGYGYDPARAVWEIVGLSALAWIVYRRTYLAGNIVPTEKDAYESFRRDGQPPPHYTPFAPLVYSVENSLPLVKLGQEDKWHPEPDSGSALSRRSNWPTRLAGPRTWTHFQWLQRRLILRGLLRDPVPKGEPPRLQRFLVFCGLQPHPDREAARSRPSRWLTSPRFVRWFLWIQILLGWLLATLFLAGLTGIVRKE